MKNKDKANKKSKQHKVDSANQTNNNINEISEHVEENLSIAKEKENSKNFLLKLGNLLNDQLDNFDNLPFIYNINKNLFDSNNFIFSFIHDLKSHPYIKSSFFDSCTYSIKDFLIINVAEDIIEIKKFINENRDLLQEKEHNSLLFKRIIRIFNNLYKLSNGEALPLFAKKLNKIFSLLTNFILSCEHRIKNSANNLEKILKLNVDDMSNELKAEPLIKNQVFSKFSMTELINSGNQYVKNIFKENNIEFNVFGKNILEEENLTDFSWLEKLKLHLHAYCAEECSKNTDKNVNQGFITQKEMKNNEHLLSEKIEGIIDIEKKFNHFSKKLKDTTTIDLLLAVEKIEYYVNSFYVNFLYLLEQENLSLNNTDKILINENFKKGILEYFTLNINLRDRIELLSIDDNENFLKAYDFIILIFDILAEVYLTSEIYEKITTNKISKRSEKFILLEELTYKPNGIYNENSNSKEKIEGSINNEKEEEESLSSKKLNSKALVYDKINNVCEEFLEIDPTIFRDDNFFFSVFINKYPKEINPQLSKGNLEENDCYSNKSFLTLFQKKSKNLFLIKNDDVDTIKILDKKRKLSFIDIITKYINRTKIAFYKKNFAIKSIKEIFGLLANSKVDMINFSNLKQKVGTRSKSKSKNYKQIEHKIETLSINNKSFFESQTFVMIKDIFYLDLLKFLPNKLDPSLSNKKFPVISNDEDKREKINELFKSLSKGNYLLRVNFLKYKLLCLEQVISKSLKKIKKQWHVKIIRKIFINSIIEKKLNSNSEIDFMEICSFFINNLLLLTNLSTKPISRSNDENNRILLDTFENFNVYETVIGMNKYEIVQELAEKIDLPSYYFNLSNENENKSNYDKNIKNNKRKKPNLKNLEKSAELDKYLLRNTAKEKRNLVQLKFFTKNTIPDIEKLYNILLEKIIIKNDFSSILNLIEYFGFLISSYCILKSEKENKNPKKKSNHSFNHLFGFSDSSSDSSEEEEMNIEYIKNHRYNDEENLMDVINNSDEEHDKKSTNFENGINSPLKSNKLKNLTNANFNNKRKIIFDNFSESD